MSRAGLTSWAPVPLGPALSGDVIAARPAMLRRTDGVALLYDGKTASVYSEPEGCKSWLACLAIAEQINLSVDVLYFDFEDDVATIVARLLALGVDRERISAYLHYVRPEEPISEEAWEDLASPAQRATLAVVDGFNEALAVHGLESRDNTDISKFNRAFLRPLRERGEKGILLLDHVTKDKESRGRYAIGAQQKLGLVDVAYSLHVIQPFGHGREGRVAIKVRKDRPGHVRTHQGPDGQIAMMELSSQGAKVSIRLEPPAGTGETFRPTVLMERLSQAVETQPGISKRDLRAAVKGQSQAKDRALELLIAEGFVDPNPGAGGHKHTSIRPFREDDQQGAQAPGVPLSFTTNGDGSDSACPSGVPPVPGAANGARDSVPPPLYGGARGTPPLASDDEDAEAARLLAVSLTDEEAL